MSVQTATESGSGARLLCYLFNYGRISHGPGYRYERYCPNHVLYFNGLNKNILLLRKNYITGTCFCIPKINTINYIFYICMHRCIAVMIDFKQDDFCFGVFWHDQFCFFALLTFIIKKVNCNYWKRSKNIVIIVLLY